VRKCIRAARPGRPTTCLTYRFLATAMRLLFPFSFPAATRSLNLVYREGPPGPKCSRVRSSSPPSFLSCCPLFHPRFATRFGRFQRVLGIRTPSEIFLAAFLPPLQIPSTFSSKKLRGLGPLDRSASTLRLARSLANIPASLSNLNPQEGLPHAPFPLHDDFFHPPTDEFLSVRVCFSLLPLPTTELSAASFYARTSVSPLGACLFFVLKGAFDFFPSSFLLSFIQRIRNAVRTRLLNLVVIFLCPPPPRLVVFL